MGFTKSSRPEVGALMAVPAVAVPVGGRIQGANPCPPRREQA